VVERVDTVVVGGGQAGLAVSWFLTQQDREHVVLERGRVANTWRTERWDSFTLNTPNFAQLLPGAAYEGPHPERFAPLSEVIDYIEGYARSFRAPVREGVAASTLRRTSTGYVVETDDGELEARNVVVATGAFQQPRPMVPETETAPVELQLKTSEYRNPAQLPDGAVLVVGGGQSGCQITEELLLAGRNVHLSVGRCAWFPRRYRGRELLEWGLLSGLFDQTVDTLASPAARLAGNATVCGDKGGHDCHPRWLAGRGASIVGRLEAIEGGVARFAPGTEAALASGDAFAANIMAGFDDYIAAQGLDAPEAEQRDTGPPSPVEDLTELDLRAHDVSTIVWSTGYRQSYGWIELAVTDDYGLPTQRRGVSKHDGLYFVGVNWLHKRKSALFCGVGEDAEYVVSHLVGRSTS